MSVREMIRKLDRLPPNAEFVLGFDWGEPILDTSYLVMANPTVSITNTQDSKARVAACL